MSAVAAAFDRLHGAVGELRAAAESPLASDAELLAALQVLEGIARQVDHLNVATVATLQRRGTFTGARLQEARRGAERPDRL